ncbi:MAG: efflux RND transporter periplasmic adaptor subunit, partial [Haliea sp.]|uniref:efflux RND transporter periplasmic adaptor subunit n=1 Tax=Haliea sp. TaxID=1932666 RepID=UPI0032EF4C7F
VSHPMPRTKNQHAGSYRTLLVSFAVAAALTGILTTAIALRAQIEDQPRPAPMPVTTTVFELQQGYTEALRLTGLVQAQSRAQLAFEVPGLLVQLSVREGEPVVAGAVLGQLDTRQLEAQRAVAAADLASVEADLELARLRSARSTSLRATGAISAQDSDEARLAAEALASRREGLQARLASLDLDLEKSTLRAPYAGVVAARQVDPGTVLAAGTPVLQLVSTGSLEARIGVPAEHRSQLSAGSRYPLQLRTGTVQATLAAVRADLDPRTRTALAVFDLPATATALDGEIATLVLAQTVPATGGWLPISALLEGERGAWTVLRLDRRGDGATIAAREAVEVLHIDGNRAYVRGSLQAGQRVIADGIHRIAADTPVQPLES